MMDLYAKATQKYAFNNNIINKTRQVILLYEAAIRYISMAKESIVKKDIQERYNNLEKAINIVQGLSSALDFENGKEIANLLENYYFSIYMRLVNVNISNSIETCEAVINELQIMLEAWKDVDKQVGNTSSNEANVNLDV